MTITDPDHWKEPGWDQGPKYDKIVEIIAQINSWLDGTGDIVVDDIDIRGDLSITESFTGFEAGVEAPASNNMSARLFMKENTGGTTGFSLIYAGAANPTLLGTAFTLTANKFYIIRHDGSATGTVVMDISRTTGNVFFAAVNINVAGGTTYKWASDGSLIGKDFTALLSASATSTAFAANLVETTTGPQFMFRSVGSAVLSTTQTYRGVDVEWGSVTRDGGAPILQGIRSNLPASYAGFGASHAARFLGAGDDVKFCDGTYAVYVDAGDARFDGQVNFANGTTYRWEIDGDTFHKTINTDDNIELSKNAAQINFNGTVGPLRISFAAEIYWQYQTSPDTLVAEHSDGTELFIINRSAKTVTNPVLTTFNNDLLFSGDGSGVPFGQIWVEDNITNTVIGVAGTFVQVLIFDQNGESNDAVPDHTNDHITITTAGRYFVAFNGTVESVAGGGIEIEVEIQINNGTPKPRIHTHRTMSGGGGDTGSVSAQGILDLAASDTVELWIANITNTNNLNVEAASLTVFMIGGT